MLSIILAAATGFDLFADGTRLHLLAGGRDADGRPALTHRVSSDGGRTWSAGARVEAGQRPAYRFVAGDAQVAAAGDAIYAVWSATGTGPMGTGALVASRSLDGGKTWVPAGSPSAGGEFGRRFVEVAATGRGLSAVWLDRSRGTKVMAARSTDGGGRWSRPVAVDGEACECCWNAMAADGERVWALWRDKDPRDMSAALSRDGGATWGRPARVGPFDWGFNGCPHVGGALAVSGGRLHALVWTGKDGRAGLYASSSGEGGAKWSGMTKVGGPGAKHSDLAAGGGRLAAVWDEDGAVWAATSADGAAWSAPRRLSGAKVLATHPRIAAAGGAFRAFWLEKDWPEGAARLVSAPVDARGP